MKRGIFLFVLIASILTGLSAEDGWREDADRGAAYFQARDYDAAWLFYERSLAKSCDDGEILFKTAESFRLQELPDNPRIVNPEYESSLYAVARYFLQGQYPDSSSLAESEKYIDEGTVVNRRFLKQAYAFVGGTAPKKIPGDSRLVSSGIGALSGFFLSRVEDMGEFVFILGSGDIKGAALWAKSNIWNLLLSILVLNSLTGIILPIVMALTVAREGRKSYVTAYAFLFHWGILGIHRFYLGRYISGVVWLLTGGLFGIGVFFDIFLTGAYIRFWNEDHQDERPVNRSSSVGRIKQQKVKKVKPPKAPKAVKPPKVKKPKKTKSRESSAEIDTSEEFSFPGDIGTAPANPVEPMLDLEVTEPPVESEPNQDLDLENDFGDLPDLSFDDDGADDFSASPDLPEELGEELSDEDFDIKSLE